MNRILICILFVVAFDANAVSTTFFYTNKAQVKFSSDAPQELIKAESTDLRGLIDIEKKTFVFKVLIRTFEGFNSALQKEHFNEKFLESENYPEAHFTGKIIEEIDFNVPGTYTIRAKGKLSIHGIEMERIIKTEIIIKSTEIYFETKFNVLLIEHNIKVPKVVHEKISSEISVEIKGTLKKKILE